MGNTQPKPIAVRAQRRSEREPGRTEKPHTSMDDYDWDRANMTGLNAREALDLALRCDPQRKTDNCIILITDPSSLVETSYERICFNFKGAQVDVAQVYAARMLCLAWTAIAQCPEYGFSENPTFWKHVFAAKYTWPITGCARFFTSQRSSGGGLYPRVELALGDVEDGDSVTLAYGIFCGATRPLDAQVEEQALNSVLAQLAPHMSQARAASSSLDVTLNIRLRAMPTLPLSSMSEDSQPAIVFSGVQFKSPVALMTEISTQALASIFAQDSVTITRLVAHMYPSLQLHGTTHFLQSTICPTPTAGIRELTLQRRTMNDSQFQALCSALPHTRTLRSLALGSAGRYGDSTDHDLAWLGYALFHPASATSSWEHLQFQMQASHQLSVRELWRLLVRNNQDGGVYMAYSHATLAAGTELRTASTGDSAVMGVVSSSVDVDISPNTHAPVDGWLHVIMPMVGLCWVESSAVVGEVRERRARTDTCITRLDISHRNDVPRQAERLAVTTFVQAVGANLKALDIRFGGVFEDEALLESMLRECPKLTSLSVTHDGYVWKKESASTTGLPELRELHLSIPSPSKFNGFSDTSITTGSLRRLRALRVSSRDNLHSVFRGVVPVINAHGALQYFHLLGPSGMVGHRNSKRQLMALGVKPELFQHTASRREAILALLGVIHWLEKDDKTMATFGNDVLRRIASFMEPHEPKILWFET